MKGFVGPPHVTLDDAKTTIEVAELLLAVFFTSVLRCKNVLFWPSMVSTSMPFALHMGVSKNRGTPKWMVKIMENPIKHGTIWGVKPPLCLVQHPYVVGVLAATDVFFPTMMQFYGGQYE